MAATQLTKGAIPLIASGEVDTSNFIPVLQITDVRLVATSTSVIDRYRLMLSDGEFNLQGMLSTGLNELVKSGQLLKGSIVQLDQYVCNTIQNKKIIIITAVNVILDKCDLIGVTKSYPAEIDLNAASLARPSAPGNPMIQPVVTAGNSPSYNTSSSISGSAPRPTMGAGFAGSQVQPSGEDFNGGAHSHSSTFSGSMNSGRYNPSNVSRVHPKPEVGLGFQQAPLNNYVRQPNTSYHQPSPISANRGPIAKSDAPPRIIPIDALTPYQGRWTIKARVTAKSEIRLYNNSRGDGKVFSFDLLDSVGGEIRVTCFNAVVDQFYHQIDTGRVYMISYGRLKDAQKTFNHLRNDKEIMLDDKSTVQPCYEDDKSIPQQQFHFQTISDIEGLDNNSVVDLIAIVSSISPPSSVMRKNGTETQKRTLQLKDMSGRSVELTMWGNFCNAEGQTLQTMCDSGLFPVLAVKAGRVNDFNGKSVGTISSTQLLIEPDFPEAQKLKTWFDSEGKSTPAISLSTGVACTDVRKTICQIKDEKLGTNERPDWITILATVQFIRADPFCYTACPLMISDRKCNKKVVNNGDSTWRCEKCEKSFNECDYRYILQMRIEDHTGTEWVTAFQEIGQEIIGRSAKEMYCMKYEDQDEEQFSEVMREALFKKYMFKLKVIEENFQDEQRVKSTVVKAEKYNLKTETKYLLDFLATSKECDLGAVPPISQGMPTPVPTTGGSGLPAAAAQSMSSNLGREGGNASMRQYGNPYGGGSRFSSSGMYTSCATCESPAHNSENCPSLMTGPGQSFGTGGGNMAVPRASGGGGGGASGDCYKCHQPGHWARECPSVANAPPAYGNNNNNPTRGGACFKCGQPGHRANDCPVATNNAAAGRYGMVPKQHIGGY